MKHWTREESKERFPKAMTPLGWSLLQVPLEATLSQMSKTFGVKNYKTWDMLLWKDNYVYSRKDFFKSLNHLQFNYGQLFKIFIVIFKSFFKTVFKWKEKGKFKDKFLLRSFHELFGNQIQGLVKRWPVDKIDLKNRMGRDFKLQLIHDIDYDTFLKIKNQMQEDSKVFFAEDFNVYFFKKLLFEIIKSELKSAGMDANAAEEKITSLTIGQSENFSVQMARDFQNQQLSNEELKNRYGHLTDNWDLFAPTLGENESFWTMRKIPGSQNKNKNENASEDAKKDILSRLAWNDKITEMIFWFEQLVLIDEDLRAYSSLQYPQARQLMKLVEKSTPFKELIVKENAVYFLDLIEIEHGLRKKDFHPYFDLIKSRKFDFEKALKSNPPFEFLQHDNGHFEIVKKIEMNTQVLKGSCVSQGLVSGVVLIVNDSSDISKINKQTIIVLSSATPVYAPIYALSGGIISEMGGQLSHGAIVAREFNIPMLTGVENACVILKNGQSIILDADQGVVKVQA
jgi:phosphohistidine swiveling domain-containing protein